MTATTATPTGDAESKTSRASVVVGVSATQTIDASSSASAKVTKGTVTVGLAGSDAPSRDLSSIDRLYPHLFDESEAGGQARIHIGQALKDAQLALHAFGEADLDTVSTRLTLVAPHMAKAYTHTEFNPSLGAVVSYVRRAVLQASPADVSRSALNALVSVLQSALDDPAIELDEAADLTEKLANEGWNGDHVAVNELIAAMADDPELEAEVQALLFPERPAPIQTE
jgi:hypothetical protein